MPIGPGSCPSGYAASRHIASRFDPYRGSWQVRLFGLCLSCWNAGERYVNHGPFWGGWPQRCECQPSASSDCCSGTDEAIRDPARNPIEEAEAFRSTMPEDDADALSLARGEIAWLREAIRRLGERK